MDWNRAIERNSEALRRIVAMLVAMAGLAAKLPISPLVREMSGRTEGGDVGRRLHASAGRPTLPRRLHRAILRLLRPAESAVRRLIVVAARGLVVPPSPARARQPKPASIFLRKGVVGTGIVLPPGALPGRPRPRSLSLPLFDPLQKPFHRRRPAAKGVPRISLPGITRPFPVAPRRQPTAGDLLDATRLALRLQALAAALDDLPGQAKRFARWRASLKAARSSNQPAAAGSRSIRRIRRVWPLRPGRPPGSGRKHEVHEILTELHALAFEVMEHPDTS